MPVTDATALAHAWLEAASECRTYLTNGNWAEPPRRTSPTATAGPSWDPICESTFDGGVVAIADAEAFILWVQDED